MDYNLWIDLAIIGGIVCILIMLSVLIDKPKRGATPEPDPRKLAEHQATRRILMEDGEYG